MQIYLFWLSLCRLNAFSQGDFYAVSARSKSKTPITSTTNDNNFIGKLASQRRIILTEGSNPSLTAMSQILGKRSFDPSFAWRTGDSDAALDRGRNPSLTGFFGFRAQS
jgi:hypothetical protein